MIKRTNTKQLFFIFIAFALILSTITTFTEKLFFEHSVQKAAMDNGIYKTKEREELFKSFLEQSETILYALRELEQFNSYLQNSSTDQQKELEIIFKAFAKSQKSCMQLRFIDKDGIEKIRIEKEDISKAPFIIAKEKLQDKSKRYYFLDSKNKTPEKVWFSKLDLNIEKGDIELPFKPTLRAVLPIQYNGEFFGILSINYFMEEFLRKFVDTPLYHLILCDDKGSTLVHHEHCKDNKTKCWGNSLAHQYNIKDEFPKEYKHILEQKIYKTEELVSRELDLPIKGGLYLILQLKQSYLEEQNLQSLYQYITITIIQIVASLLLTLLIIRFFSEKLLNLQHLSKADQEILNKNEQINFVLEKVQAVAWEADLKSQTITYSNHSFFDYKQNEVDTFDKWMDNVHPEDKEHAQESIQKLVDGAAESNILLRYKKKNGTYIWLDGRSIEGERVQGKLQSFKGITYDITESYSKKLEFESIFKSSKDGIAIMNLEADFLDFNDAYLKMTEFTHEELLQKNCLELTAPEYKEQTLEVFRILFKQGYFENFEKECIMNHNKRINANITVTMLPDKKRILLVMKDITGLKSLESQAKLASMGEMIGNIAHQWRQPLSTISTCASGMKLQSEYDMLEKNDLENYADIIVQQTEYLSKTIDNFRDFIKDDFTTEEISIVDTIQYALSVTDAALKDNYIMINTELNEDITILGNSNEFSQALINIFNNAKDVLIEKVKDEKDRILSICTAKLDEESLEITIKDNGGGIDQNIIQRVFEPYFSTKHQSVGTGLGLSMAYQIITERHHCFLKVENEEFSYNNKKYKGACFKIVCKKILESNTKRSKD